MFTEEDYHKKLPTELVKALKKYVKKSDVEEVCKRFSTGEINILRVRSGKNSLNKSSHKSIVELVNIAKKNSKEEERVAKRTSEFLKRYK